MENKLTEREIRELIKKIEHSKNRKDSKPTKEMYKKETDRNYKDGDRN